MFNRADTVAPQSLRLPPTLENVRPPMWVSSCILILAVVLHALHILPGLGNTLEGPHDFRQAQTAI